MKRGSTSTGEIATESSTALALHHGPRTIGPILNRERRDFAGFALVCAEGRGHTRCQVSQAY